MADLLDTLNAIAIRELSYPGDTRPPKVRLDGSRYKLHIEGTVHDIGEAGNAQKNLIAYADIAE